MNFFSGMTDWGSHGAGDDTETLTPLLTWGSGIRSSRHTNVHFEQADLCPLMSYFLGLDYSVNSVGRLPIDYLSPVDEDLLQAYLQNARQLLEQVHQQHDQLKKRLLFLRPYDLNEEKFFERMQTLEGYMNLYQIRDDIKGKNKPSILPFKSLLFSIDFMHHVALASHYYHTYRRFLLSILIILGFFTSLSTILYQLNPIKPSASLIGLCGKIISIVIFLLFLIEQSPWTHLLYPALVCVHTWLSIDFAITWIRQKGVQQMKSFSFWLNLVIIGSFLQTYILPFFYRWTMSIGIFLLFLDAIRRWQG
jgi:phosphatidylinositol glycan class N